MLKPSLIFSCRGAGAGLLLVFLLNPHLAQAGAWALPDGQAEIMVKRTASQDISAAHPRQPRFSQNEVYTQFGLGHDFMLTMTYLAPRTSSTSTSKTGGKHGAEVVYAIPKFRTGLLPPGVYTVLSKWSGGKLKRQKSTSLGVGFDSLQKGNSGQFKDFYRTSIAIGDKLELGDNFNLLGQVSWTRLTSRDTRVNDMQALIQVEAKRLAIGYEYGYVTETAKSLIETDTYFIELPLGSKGPKLRLTSGKKSYDSNRQSWRMTGIWLRVPFQL